MAISTKKVKAMPDGITFNKSSVEAQSNEMTPETLKKWFDGVSNTPTVEPQAPKLHPIGTIIKDEKVIADAVRTAITARWHKSSDPAYKNTAQSIKYLREFSNINAVRKYLNLEIQKAEIMIKDSRNPEDQNQKIKSSGSGDTLSASEIRRFNENLISNAKTILDEFEPQMPIILPRVLP
jgi:hypothetical protein